MKEPPAAVTDAPIRELLNDGDMPASVVPRMREREQAAKEQWRGARAHASPRGEASAAGKFAVRAPASWRGERGDRAV